MLRLIMKFSSNLLFPSLSGFQKYNIYLRMWTNHLESAFFIKIVHINNGDVNQMMTTASLYFKILKGYVL